MSINKLKKKMFFKVRPLTVFAFTFLAFIISLVTGTFTKQKDNHLVVNSEAHIETRDVLPFVDVAYADDDAGDDDDDDDDGPGDPGDADFGDDSGPPPPAPVAPDVSVGFN